MISIRLADNFNEKLYEQNQNLLTVMTASKQQTIADTARRLFREHGFSAVSVGGICTEAAVSRVTFYKYYSGKNALLQEIVTEQKNRVRAEFENLLARQCSLREAADGCVCPQNNRLKNFIPPLSCATSKRTPIWSWSGFSTN